MNDKINTIRMLQIFRDNNWCYGIRCSTNEEFGGLDCPLRGRCNGLTIDNFGKVAARRITELYGDFGMNDDYTPSWLLEFLNAGIHPSVKWFKGVKTLHGRCVAVIDELAVIVSKKDPSKVLTVSVERISEDV